MEMKIEPDAYWKSEIARFLKGDLTFSEEQVLHQWIKENDEHSQLFEEIRNAWISSLSSSSDKIIIDNDWKQMNKRFDESGSNLPTIKPKNSLSFRKIASIAAILVLAMAIGGIVSIVVFPGYFQGSEEVCEIITPLGAKSMVILPDSSEVWLNAGSKLTYKKSFNTKNRLVTLKGEAFFRVKTNKSKPFIVHTAKLNVKALGTTFNVKAYPEDKIVTATLVEGIIQVEGHGANAKPFVYTLKSKETISIHGKTIESKPKKEIKPVRTVDSLPERIEQVHPNVLISKNVNTENFTSWKDPDWQVAAENLDNLSVLLERRFNVKIYKESENLKDYRFTGTIKNETLEQVLEILKLTTPLKCRIGKGELWWDIDTELEKHYSKILTEKNVRK